MAGKRHQKYRRTKPYVEDSTKGESLMRPKKYKNDVMVQVWLESRLLATLSQWLEKEGRIPRYLSEVVREPLEILVRHLTELGEVRMVESTVEARAMLERRYRIQLNKTEKGEKNKLHNITLDNQRMELGESINTRIERNSADYMNTPLAEKKRHFSAREEEDLLKHAGRELDKIRDAEMLKEVGKERVMTDDSAIVVQEVEVETVENEPVVDESETFKKGDLARPATDEEIEMKEIEREKKDREQLDAFKNMND